MSPAAGSPESATEIALPGAAERMVPLAEVASPTTAALSNVAPVRSVTYRVLPTMKALKLSGAPALMAAASLAPMPASALLPRAVMTASTATTYCTPASVMIQRSPLLGVPARSKVVVVAARCTELAAPTGCTDTAAVNALDLVIVRTGAGVGFAWLTTGALARRPAIAGSVEALTAAASPLAIDTSVSPARTV